LESLNTDDTKKLKAKIKSELFDLIFLKDYNRNEIQSLQTEVFSDVKQYEYLSRYHAKIPKVEREIALCLLKDPAN
jgi:hypothetical protein